MNFLEYCNKYEEIISETKKEIKSVLTEEEENYNVDNIDPKFISRLLNYVDSKCFFSYGDFDVAVGNEIRKYMKGDNSYVKKVKKRIHDIINKARNKFLMDVSNKIEKIKVQPKPDPKKPSMIINPLLQNDDQKEKIDYNEIQ